MMPSPRSATDVCFRIDRGARGLRPATALVPAVRFLASILSSRNLGRLLGVAACCLGTGGVRGAFIDASAPQVIDQAQYAGNSVSLRVTDNGVVRATSVPSAPTSDIANSDGVVGWSGGATLYCYTYDPYRVKWTGTSAPNVGSTSDLRSRQGMVAWSSRVAGVTTVYYYVYDWLRGSWVGGSLSLGLDTALGLDVSDGVVTWSTASVVYFRTFDPVRGVWANGSGPGPTSDLTAVQGVVAWSVPGISGGVLYSVYDPRTGGWKGGSKAGPTFDLHNLNGVVAWSVGPLVSVRTFDPAAGAWKEQDVPSGNTTDLNIFGATVQWSTSTAQFFRGYTPAGGWGAHTAAVLPFFVTSGATNNAPFMVAFVDMSLGGSSWSWDFGDGSAASTRRSPFHSYTTFGRYNATLNLNGGTASRPVITDITPPTGTLRINGGDAITTNVAVTLHPVAADNSGGVATMRFANDTPAWTVWEPYATNRAWTLSAGGGTKKVLTQFRDAALNTSAVVEASIQYDTTLLPTVRLIDTNVTEAIGSVTLTVNLDHPFNLPVSVRYATADGTATAGLDYVATNGLIVFPARATNANIRLAIKQDSGVEINETVLIEFSSPTNAVLGPTGVVTILDDEAASVFFATNSFSALEGSGVAQVILRTSAPSGQKISVRYHTFTNGTAQAGSDFTNVTGVAIFAPGETTQVISIPLHDDLLDELSESFGLVLDGATNAVVGVPAEATVTILDDDNPLVFFSASTYEAFENAGVVTVSVWLSKRFGQDVAVDYTALGGSATPGSDYVPVTGTLQFLAGQTNKSFFVTLFNDMAAEPDETIHLVLSSPFRASLGARAEAEIRVLDDERPPRFVTAVVDGAGRFKATVRGAAGQKFKVEYSANWGQWLPLTTLTNGTGTVEFTDSTLPLPNGPRYYRTALP